MKCSNCNSENSDTAKFCKKCGAPLSANTINHETMINSISDNKTQSGDNTTKIIIIALAIVAVVLAGAFIYLFAFNNSGASDSSNAGSASQSSNQVETAQPTSSQPASSKPSTSSMRILGGSFSTGSAESDKTYAQIYVGTQYAGQDVIVQIFYSRNGNALNHGNMVPASVHSDGYLYIARYY